MNINKLLNPILASIVLKASFIIKPLVDSITAFRITKADGTTAVATVDTTNSIVYVKSGANSRSAVVVVRAGGTEQIIRLFEDASGNGVLRALDAGGADKVFLSSAADSYLAGGNLGIGTTAPGRRLHIASESDHQLNLDTISASEQFTTLGFRNNNVAKSKLRWDNTNKLLEIDGAVGPVCLQTISHGNVGVDVTAPTEKLDVAGNIRAGIKTAATDKSIKLIAEQYDSATETEGALPLFAYNDATGNTVNVGGGSPAQNAATLVRLYAAANATTRTGTEILRAAINGVGIGAVSPTAKLDVLSAENSEPVMRIKGTGTADLLNVMDNTTEVFTILDGGKVGINIVAPSSPLEVKSSAISTSAIAVQRSGGTQQIIRLYESADGNGRVRVLNNAQNDRVYLSSDGDNYIAPDNDGKFGVGVTAPTEKLDVAGNIRAGIKTAATDKSIKLIAEQYDSATETEGALPLFAYNDATGNTVNVGGGSSSQNAATLVRIYAAANTTTRTGTEIMRADINGIGIGGVTPTSKLDVNGDIEVTGTSSVYFGDPTTNGSGRVRYDNATQTFYMEKRSSGSWVPA